MPPVTEKRELASPPPADRLALRATAALAKDAVDSAKGTIAGVSLLTADREAAGHGVWIDRRTLETFETQLSGRPLKAYVTHGWGDPTLNEVGLWRDPVIDDAGKSPQLRSDFTALEAWKTHKRAEFDTLFELATKAPTEFGASLSFRFSLVWVRKDGTELATTPGWKITNGNFARTFDPPAPADAVRAMPSVRAIEVYSADFVDTPAANDGLLRAGSSGAPVDVPASHETPRKKSASPMLKDLNAKFRDHPKRLARAIDLHLNDDKLSLEAIVSTVEHERTESELGEFRTQVATLTATVEQNKKDLAAKDTEIATLKTQATKDADTIAQFKKGGASPVDLGTGTAEGASGKTMSRAEWSKLKPIDGQKFILNGGYLTD